MSDVPFVGLGLAFFAACFGLLLLCERLMEK